MSGRSFVYDAPYDGQPGEKPANRNITICVFFDGTCNNRANVIARSKYEENQAEKKSKKDLSKEEKAYRSHMGDSSYENDHTNVDKLEKMLEADDAKAYKIYIEGIGTDNLEGDDAFGMAFGRGDNGIRGKVRDACEKVSLLIDSQTTRRITFDVFGFSRGAAAARNFVHEVTRTDGLVALSQSGFVDEQYYSKDAHIPPRGFLGYFLNKNQGMTAEEINALKIKFHFIGLFDTVPSYGISHKRDASQLQLNKISIARHTFHIVSKDEHRKNFSLAPVNTGKTVVMPGCHSDIGGGYTDNHAEKDYILLKDELRKERVLEEKQDLIDEGWFREKELTVEQGMIETLPVHSLTGSRRNIRNGYAKIPLQVMAEEWKEKSEIELKDEDDYYILETSPTYENIASRLIKDRLTSLISHQDKSEEYDAGHVRIDYLLREVNLHLNKPMLEVRTSSDKFQNELLCYIRKKMETDPLLQSRSAKEILSGCGIDMVWLSYVKTGELKQCLDTLVESIVEQMFYRILRNECLHWSARYAAGMAGIAGVNDPNIVRERRERNIYNA